MAAKFTKAQLEAEKAQRHAEIYYRALFEQTHDAVFIMDLKGNHLAVNQRAADMLGYKVHEILGLSVADTSAQQEQSREVVIRLMNGEHIAPYERIFRKKDGSHIMVEINVELVKDVDGKPLHIQSVVRDITERKQAEDALKKSEAQYRLLAENINDILWLMDLELHIVYISPSTTKVQGFTLEELQATTLEEQMTKESYERVMIFYEEALSPTNLSQPNPKLVYDIDLEFYKKDGATYWSRNTFQLLLDENGQPVNILGVGRDITTRKRAENELRKSEERYRIITEDMPAMICRFLADGTITFANSFYCNYFNTQCKYLIGSNFFLLVPETQRDFVRTNYLSLDQKNPFITYEYKAFDTDGKESWQKWTDRALFNEQGQVVEYQSIGEDITERKLAEQQLIESEARLRALIANTGDLIVVIDEEGNITFASPSSERIFGYKPEESMGKNFSEWIHPEDLPEAMAAFQSRKQIPGTAPQSIHVRGLHKDGSLRYVESLGTNLLDDPAIRGIVLNIRDVTEQKRAELEKQALYEIMQGMALSKNLNEFLTLAHYSIGSVIRANNIFVTLYNPISGLFEDAYHVDQYDQPLHPSKREGTLTAYIFRTGVPLLVTDEKFDKLSAAKEVKLVGMESQSWLGVPLKTAGKTIGVMAIQDYEISNLYSEKDMAFLASISGQVASAVEKKQAEERLHESEKRFSSAFENAPIGMALTSTEGQMFKVNQAFCDFLGYSEGELTDQSFQNITHPDDLETNLQYLQDMLAGKIQTFQVEKRYVHKLGHYVWGSLSVSLVRNDEGIPLYLVSHIKDVTERKRADEKFRGLLESAPDGVVVADEFGKIILVNSQTEKLFGYNRADIIGQSIEILVPNRLREKHLAHRAGYSVDAHIRPMGLGVELYGQHQNGTEFPVEISLSPLETETGTLISASIRDITQRKQSEEALRLAEEKYRAIFEKSLEGIFQSTPAGRFITVNPALARMWGYDSPEDLVTSVTDIAKQIYGNPAVRAEHLRLLSEQGGDLSGFEYQAICKDGSTIWVSESVRSIQNADGALLYFEGIVENISSRKQAEETLRESEASLNRAQAVAHTGSWDLDLTKNILIWSAESYRIFGVAPETPITLEYFLARVHPDDRESVGRSWQAALQGAPYDIEHRILVGQQVKWVRERAELEADADGSMLHGIGTVQDITERKLVEGELRETKNFVTTLLDLAPISIYVMSLDNTFRLLNRQWEEDSRIRREDALGHSIDELFSPKVAQQYQAQNQRVAESGASLAFEEWVEESNGLHCYYTLKFPLRDANGLLESIGGISLDITERKQADEKLSESERRYRNLFEGSPIPLWEEDFSQAKKYLDNLKRQGLTDFRAYFKEYPEMGQTLNQMIEILDVNQATLKMYGAKDKESLFKNTQEPSQGELDHNHEDFIAILEGRTSNSWDGPDKTMTGEPLEISLSWSVVPGYEDDYSKVIITTHDITERKLAKDKIKESEQRYRSLFEDSPISLWEDDYSAVKLKLDELKRAGITDFETYFATHPEVAAECTSLIKILDANKFSVKLFNAKSKQELLANTRRLLNTEVIGYRGLINFASGLTHFEWEGVNQKLSGELMNIKLTWSVAPGHEGDMSKVIISITDITETKLANEILKESEKRYRSLFENSPISLWEEDFSAVKQKMDGLKREGITDFEAYFSERPDEVIKFASLIKVLDVNNASIKLFKAKEKAELLSNLGQLITIPAQQFMHELILISKGLTHFEREAINRDMNGNMINVHLTWSVAPGYENDLSKVIISIIDTTERKQAETEISRQLTELETLYESGLAISRLLTPKQVVQKVIEVLDRNLNWHHIAIRQYQSETNSVELIGFNRPGISTEEAEEFIVKMNQLITNPSQGLSGWVTMRGESLLVHNVKTDERYVDTFSEINSGLYVPLKIGRRVIGSISVESEKENAFTENDKRLLETLAGQAAIAIENANLFLMAQREIMERKQAELLLQKDNQVMQLIASGALSFHETLEAITNNVEALSPASFCSILLLDKDGIHLRHASAPSLPMEYNLAINGVAIGEGVGSCGTAAYRGESVIVSDIASDPLWVDYRELALNHGLRACWSTPIKNARGLVLGTFAIYHPEPYTPSETDFKLIERATQQAKIVIERELAESALQTQTEELLKLNNKLEQRVKERTVEIEVTRKRLELATDAAGLGIWEWDIETGDLIWDAQMYRIYGVSPEDFDGKIDAQLRCILMEDQSILLGAAQAIMENKENNFKIEHRIFHGHGDIHTLFEQGVAVFDEHGLLERIIGIVNDVTAQKQAEQNLRESEAYARLLFDAAPDPVSVAEVDGIMVDVNRLFEQQHQIQREDVRDRHISELNIFPPEQLAKAQGYIMAIVAGKEVPPVELNFYAPGGGQHTLEMHSYPIDVKGRSLVLSTSRDITLHKKAEESLRFANSEMERALRMKDEFLANMSHELRTPLNAVLGMSESLEEQFAGPLNEKQLKYIRTISESGKHLLELINDILDLSKIEAGRLELNVSQVSVSSLCDASLRMVKEQAQKKNLKTSLTIDPEVKIIMGDERRLKQSLVNLLSNAVKFTPEGHEVGVEVKGNNRNQTVTFTVWDEGIGMAPEELNLIFKPFVQLDSGLAREFSGTGLGLTLVAQMIRLHGGSVSVESKQEKGSRFSITLPWVDVEGTASAKKMPQETAAGAASEEKRSEKILIVEDTESIIMLLTEYLRYRGYQILAARNGMEGVKLATQERPDLILMDVMMPIMDGVEATKQIRANKDLQSIPIIALTALAMAGDKERCLEAGMNDYLSKPVQMKDLESLILKHILKSKGLETPP